MRVKSLDKLVDATVSIRSGHREAVKESARLAKESCYFKFQVLLGVKILAHAQISLAERVVESLDALIELEVLLFDEAHLHKGGLVAGFKSWVGLNQTLKLHDKCSQFNSTLIHLS